MVEIQAQAMLLEWELFSEEEIWSSPIPPPSKPCHFYNHLSCPQHIRIIWTPPRGVQGILKLAHPMYFIWKKIACACFFFFPGMPCIFRFAKAFPTPRAGRITVRIEGQLCRPLQLTCPLTAAAELDWESYCRRVSSWVRALAQASLLWRSMTRRAMDLPLGQENRPRWLRSPSSLKPECRDDAPNDDEVLCLRRVIVWLCHTSRFPHYSIGYCLPKDNRACELVPGIRRGRLAYFHEPRVSPNGYQERPHNSPSVYK